MLRGDAVRRFTRGVVFGAAVAGAGETAGSGGAMSFAGATTFGASVTGTGGTITGFHGSTTGFTGATITGLVSLRVGGADGNDGAIQPGRCSSGQSRYVPAPAAASHGRRRTG